MTVKRILFVFCIYLFMDSVFRTSVFNLEIFNCMFCSIFLQSWYYYQAQCSEFCSFFFFCSCLFFCYPLYSCVSEVLSELKHCPDSSCGIGIFRLHTSVCCQPSHSRRLDQSTFFSSFNHLNGLISHFCSSQTLTCWSKHISCFIFTVVMFKIAHSSFL